MCMCVCVCVWDTTYLWHWLRDPVLANRLAGRLLGWLAGGLTGLANLSLPRQTTNCCFSAVWPYCPSALCCPCVARAHCKLLVQLLPGLGYGNGPCSRNSLGYSYARFWDIWLAVASRRRVEHAADSDSRRVSVCVRLESRLSLFGDFTACERASILNASKK